MILFSTFQLLPDVFLLAAEPEGSPIIWDPTMWTGKGPWGSARPPGPRWDPVRQHGGVLHGAGGCRRPRPHQGPFSPLPERPGLCYHSGGPPPKPLRPLSPARDQPSPLRLPGKSGHASVLLHSHTASAPVLPLHSQPHASPHPNCGAGGGEGRLAENGLAVTAVLQKHWQDSPPPKWAKVSHRSENRNQPPAADRKQPVNGPQKKILHKHTAKDIPSRRDRTFFALFL